MEIFKIKSNMMKRKFGRRRFYPSDSKFYFLSMTGISCFVLLGICSMDYFLNSQRIDILTLYQPPLPSKYILIRAIGNALPPRHSPKQTLSNLEFILKNEVQDSQELEKHWVLNRIFEQQVLKDIIVLLKKYGAAYTVLPFDLKEYSKRTFNLATDRRSDMVHPKQFYYMNPWSKNDLFSDIYDSKNLYSMSINYARNVMIDIGKKSKAKWILPWDQNCFLTKRAWVELKYNTFLHGNSSKYFVTWMDRIHSENSVLLKKNYKPNPWEEPQIIFRRDATERFDEGLRYGRRDKAALLVRLNIPGPWWEWSWSAWERNRTFEKMSKEAISHSIPNAGWVARLNSGRPEFEKEGTGNQRESARALAVFDALDKLDRRVIEDLYHFNTTRLLFYDQTYLRKILQQYSKKNQTAVFFADSIITNADKVVVKPAYSILDKTIFPPSLNRQDFMSMWYAQDEDDKAINDIKTYDIRGDESRLMDMFYETTSLSFAFYFSRDTKYSAKAVSLIRTWFIQEDTAMNPNLNYADWVSMKTTYARESRISYTRYFCFFLDSVRILKEHGQLSDQDHQALQKWMRRFLNYLRHSDARMINVASNLFGVEYDLQIAAVAAFLNHKKLLIYHTDTVRARMLSLFRKDGAIRPPPRNEVHLPKELYIRRVLEVWTAMASIAKHVGINIWKFDYNFAHRVQIDQVRTEGWLCRVMKKYIPCCGGNAKRCAKFSDMRGFNTMFAVQAHVALKNCPSMNKVRKCLQLADNMFYTLDIEAAREHEIFPYALFQS